uniref:Uncharacterized protein n=1 Tax=Arundo donax TaxID=35708 RepID=A0A0A8XTD7_ARUDO
MTKTVMISSTKTNKKGWDALKKIRTPREVAQAT